MNWELGDKNNINPISIYPNPTKDNFILNTGNNTIGNASVSVVNLLGKVIYQQVVLDKNTTINLAGFSAGIYIVQFKNNTGTITQKLIKE